MRILGACIFSKFFGGKIEIFNKDLLRRKKIIKKRRMRILSARIFSKFFGGKILNFDMGYLGSKVKYSRRCFHKRTFNFVQHRLNTLWRLYFAKNLAFQDNFYKTFLYNTKWMREAS